MSESLGSDRIERRVGPFCFTETWHAPALRLAEHEHEHACVHFVLAGQYQETVERVDATSGPGTVLFKPAGICHSNRFAERGARTLRIELSPDLGEGLGERASGARKARDPRLECLGRRMHEELRDGDDLSALALEGLARELLALLLREHAAVDCRMRLAEDCAARLREQFRGPASLAGLARELGCERTALARAFRRRYGASIGEYMRALRVAEVLRRLEAQDEAGLAEIALDAGFSDQSHCTRVFRRHVGVPPTVWARTRVPSAHARSRRGAARD